MYHEFVLTPISWMPIYYLLQMFQHDKNGKCWKLTIIHKIQERYKTFD